MGHLSGKQYFAQHISSEGIQPKIFGCEEHHQKQWLVLKDANTNQCSVAVDLENGYRSVPHGLI